MSRLSSSNFYGFTLSHGITLSHGKTLYHGITLSHSVTLTHGITLFHAVLSHVLPYLRCCPILSVTLSQVISWCNISSGVTLYQV